MICDKLSTSVLTLRMFPGRLSSQRERCTLGTDIPMRMKRSDRTVLSQPRKGYLYEHHIKLFEQQYKYTPQLLHRKFLINFHSPSHLEFAKLLAKNYQEYNPRPDPLWNSFNFGIVQIPSSTMFCMSYFGLVCFSVLLFFVTTCSSEPGYPPTVSALTNIDRKSKNLERNMLGKWLFSSLMKNMFMSTSSLLLGLQIVFKLSKNNLVIKH